MESEYIALCVTAYLFVAVCVWLFLVDKHKDQKLLQNVPRDDRLELDETTARLFASVFWGLILIFTLLVVCLIALGGFLNWALPKKG